MTNSAIARLRLQNQLLTRHTFYKPADVVAWMGAVQAQDYFGALWAVGLRAGNASESDIERAIAAGEIIRTWPMRGTLHFVAPADVRWMLKLLTPRIRAAHAGRLLRHLELDEPTFASARDLFIRVLQGGRQLPRPAMYRALEEAGIPTAGQRGLQILWHLAQEGTICFAPRQGRQPAFALLDEWVPPGNTLEREEALAVLGRRFFTSHGPATQRDFAWWSGLTAADARASIEMVKSELVREVIDGQTYWLPVYNLAPGPLDASEDTSPVAHLLPAYDEYMVGYTDRSAVVRPEHAKEAGNLILGPTIELGGQIAGTWKRRPSRDSVAITLQSFVTLVRAQRRALAVAADDYGKFLGVPASFATDVA